LRRSLLCSLDDSIVRECRILPMLAVAMK
jgi:hypothetical protein